MSRLRRLALPFEEYDEDFEDDTCSNSSKSGNPPIQRNAANARERARMRVLSSAFGRLKTKLPNIPPDTKLSKLDTLRLATIYIKQLKTLAEGESDKHRNEKNNETIFQQAINNNLNSQNCASSMTWPFAFQHMHATSRQLSVTSQLPPNWHPPENFEDKLKTNENTFSCNQQTSNAADLFQNKAQINISSPDINNCLFDCIQQQQQLSYYINRNHHNYPQLSDCTDHQNQNTEIH